MLEVRETETYAKWFDGLRDTQARARILVRIRRLALGNPGDVEPVGDGVSEMRIHSGPGYRVYFVEWGPPSSSFSAVATRIRRRATSLQRNRWREN